MTLTRTKWEGLILKNRLFAPYQLNIVLDRLYRQFPEKSISAIFRLYIDRYLISKQEISCQYYLAAIKLIIICDTYEYGLTFFLLLQFILAVLFTFATARPSYLPSSPVLYSSHAYIEEPTYANVGAIVKSIPTAVSHQSLSQVHSSGHYVQPLVAPVLKTTYAGPVVKAIASPFAHASYNSAPFLQTYAHEDPAWQRYSSGTIYKSYAPTYGSSYSQW